MEWCKAVKGNRLLLAQRTLICPEEIDKIKAGKPASLRSALAIQKGTDDAVPAETLVSKRDTALLRYYRSKA